MANDETARPGAFGVQEHEVWAVADRLIEEGRCPSTALVRTELGNTGSNTTILRHLENYWLKLGRRLRQAEDSRAGRLTDSDPVGSALHQAYATLKAQADAMVQHTLSAGMAEIHALRQQLDAEREALGLEREQLHAARVEIEAERDRALARCTAGEEKLEAAQQRMANQEAALVIEQQRRTDLELQHSRATLAAAEHITNLECQLKSVESARRDLEAQLRAAQEAHATGTEKYLALLAEKTVVDRQIGDLRSLLTQAEARESRLREDRLWLEAQMQNLERQIRARRTARGPAFLDRLRGHEVSLDR